MHKLCVFDIDGTLIDSIADIGNGVNAILEKFKLPTHTVGDYRKIIGNGARWLCEHALPADRGDLLDEFFKEYTPYYEEHCCCLSEPYDGMMQTLDILRGEGVELAVISNKPHPNAVRVIAHYFPETEFAFVEGMSERYPRKPDPTLLTECMKKHGYRPEETYYVGDSEIDIAFAKAAEAHTVAASWGYRDRKVLQDSGAEFIVDSPLDIVKAVLGHIA
ncbi:MAG: HAD family hydrolase [Oscillospiraceae bacterium]